MEDEGSSSHSAVSGGGDGNPGRRYSISLNPSAFIRSPVAALLEYSGLLSPSSSSSSVASPSTEEETRELLVSSSSSSATTNTNTVTTTGYVSGDGEEVTIRIIGGPESEEDPNSGLSSSSSTGGSPVAGGESAGNEGSSSSSSYQRYDIQNFARWVEQVLPFSLLLVLVFIRQHLQGFCVALWIAVVLYKSNEVLRKQTALKGERRISVLLGVISLLLLHVVVVYWWYADDGLLYPLLLVPPKDIPLFWHGLFVIIVNDVMVRLLGMALKCVLLLYYKNTRGQNYRKQGQILTLLEYILLVYRTLLPTPVWYRFFLNKEYGSFFSSLVTGLYLTIKLMSVLSKVQLFLAAFRALSRKEMHYGSCATAEQVNAAGDLCAICQEKMRSPILLRCKHIFCEECVSEWFERERTCPLCRALVKPADIRSFSDGSTSLLFQLF